jgi:hypothetical protein
LHDTLLLQSPSQNRFTLSGRWVEPSKRDFPESSCWFGTNRRPVGVSARPSTWTGLKYDEARTHRGQPPGLHTTGRTPCGTMPERTMPSRSPFGARMQWPEPAPTEQSLAPSRARRREVPCGSALHSRRPSPSCRNDHRYFHAVHQPPARFGAGGAHRPDAHRGHGDAVPHTALAAFAHTALSAFAIPKTLASPRRPPRPRRRASDDAHRPPARRPHRPPPVTDATSVDTADWTCIRVHESGDQYNSPAAPSGAYGILISTWREFGYSGWPYEAPPACRTRWRWSCTRASDGRPWSSRFACGL